MASETEVERLIVRLVGDTEDYQQKMDEANNTAQETGADVEEAGEKVEKLGGQLGTFAQNAASALASLGLGDMLRDAFFEFANAEQVMIRMNAAIATNGGNVDELSARYDNFAVSVERSTGADGDAIRSSLMLAESMGVTGDAALLAAQNAVGLSAIYGGQADSYIRATAALENGDVALVRRILRLNDVADDAEVARIAYERMGAGMEIAEQMGQSSLGRLTILGHLYGDAMEEVGKAVAEAVQPAVEVLSDLVLWFIELDDSTTTTLVVIAGMATALLAIGPILYGITIAWTLLSAAVSPVILPIIALTAVVAILVNRMGGISKAWDTVASAARRFWAYVEPRVMPLVQQLQDLWETVSGAGEEAWTSLEGYVSDFWDFVKPIIPAWEGAFTAFWRMISGGAESAFGGISDAATYSMEVVNAAVDIAWGYIGPIVTSVGDAFTSMWEATGLSAVSSFETVNGTITDFYIAAEFAFDHVREIANYAWTGIKLGAVSTFEEILHFFTTTIPTTMDWFANNWEDIFTDLYNGTVAIFTNLSSNISAIFSNLGRLITGEVSFDELWTPLTEGFQRVTAELIIPERQVNEMEASLRRQFEQQGAALSESFTEFRNRRLDEIAEWEWPEESVEDAVDAADEAGQMIGRQLNSSIKKEAEKTEKLEAALVNSAESITRLAEYRDRLNQQAESRQAARQSAGVGGGVTAPRQSPATTASAQRDPQQSTMVDLLRIIAEAATDLAERPPLEIESLAL